MTIYRYTGTLSLRHAKQVIDEILPARDPKERPYLVNTGHRIACIKALRDVHHSAYISGQCHVMLHYQLWQLGFGTVGSDEHD